jgi:glycopeptide antibiotics resistance protein
MSDLSARLAAARVPARVAYIGIILLATLSDLRLDLDPGELGERLARMWRVDVNRRDVIDGARNVTLFAGWGLVWMVSAAPGRTWLALRNAVLTGALLSLSVESLQLLSDRRFASVLDLATNTGGALVGALALVAVVRTLASLSNGRSLAGLPMLVFGACVSVAALAEAFVPLFRQDQRVPAFGGPIERLRVALGDVEGPSLLDLPLSDLVLFVPAGIFVAAALFEVGRGDRRTYLIAAGLSAVLVALAEVAHGALGIRIGASAVLIHAAGVVGGIWLGAWGIPHFVREVRGVDRPRLLALAYAGVLLLWSLRPYMPELTLAGIVAKLASEWWVPLESLGGRMDMFSVVDVFVGFLLYLPLGALLAVWPVAKRRALAGFAPALYVGLAAELAQLFVAGRSLDATDALIHAAGAAVGWVVVRRAGYQPRGTLLD